METVTFVDNFFSNSTLWNTYFCMHVIYFEYYALNSSIFNSYISTIPPFILLYNCMVRVKKNFVVMFLSLNGTSYTFYHFLLFFCHWMVRVIPLTIKFCHWMVRIIPFTIKFYHWTVRVIPFGSMLYFATGWDKFYSLTWVLLFAVMFCHWMAQIQRI